jgi:hypothetical protein
MGARYIFLFFLQFLLAKIVTPHTNSFSWHIQVKKFGADIDISCTKSLVQRLTSVVQCILIL